MNVPDVPLVFAPVYQDYIWGGGRIADAYRRTDAPSRCAESWELSARPDGASVVASGVFAGTSLDQLAARYGAALTGLRAPDPHRFPLLVKLIDARDRLSVQVHPNNANAARTGGEPKTEMWYVLACNPGAVLFAGLAEGVTENSLRRALADGTAADSLVRLAIEPGQALYIPGGLVHAIGAGCLIYEVQQNSNTTYRLYDWDRKDSAGKPRALHIEESFQTIDWTLPPPAMLAPLPRPACGGNRWYDVVACPYFTVRKVEVAAPLAVPVTGETFHALFVAQGAAAVNAGGETLVLQTGASCLIPAAASAYQLTPAPSAELLVTTL